MLFPSSWHLFIFQRRERKWVQSSLLVSEVHFLLLFQRFLVREEGRWGDDEEIDCLSVCLLSLHTRGRKKMRVRRWTSTDWVEMTHFYQMCLHSLLWLWLISLPSQWEGDSSRIYEISEWDLSLRDPLFSFVSLSFNLFLPWSFWSHTCETESASFLFS